MSTLWLSSGAAGLVMPKSVGKHPRNIELAKKLKAGQDEIYSVMAGIDKCEKTIKDIDDNEPSWTYLDQPYAAVMAIIQVVALGLTWLILSRDSWFVILIGIVIVVGVIDNIPDVIVKKRRRTAIENYKHQLEVLFEGFYNLIEQELSPEMHNLGMTTVQGVIDNTSGYDLKPEVIEDYLENEVKFNRFEKIKLKNKILYKSKISTPETSSMDRIVLEID